MSVMILEPIAIGQLVAWAKANDVKADSMKASAHANMVVKIIETNVVAFRDCYTNVPSAAEYSTDGKMQTLVKEGAVAFNRYQNAAPNMIDAAAIYQFAKSIEYQCCGVWSPTNPVREFLARVKLKAADKMMYEIMGDAAQDAWAPDDLVKIRKKAAA